MFLQNYNRPPVMALAVPVAVKFLQRGNKELCRNMSSYLSLAAIAKAELLAEHTETILRSVLQGRAQLRAWLCHHITQGTYRIIIVQNQSIIRGGRDSRINPSIKQITGAVWSKPMEISINVIKCINHTLITDFLMEYVDLLLLWRFGGWIGWPPGQEIHLSSLIFPANGLQIISPDMRHQPWALILPLSVTGKAPKEKWGWN